MINLSTKKSFIERCVQFQEEPLAAVEVGEASSPPEPLKVKSLLNMLILICLMDMSLFQNLTALQGQNGQPRHYMQRRASWGSQ